MKSEFASLSDLALSKGISHSNLIAHIHQNVLSDFQKKFPKSPIDTSVMVDEVTGAVRLYSGTEDITPAKFAPVAAQAARQTIIDLLGTSPVQTSRPVSPVSSNPHTLSRVFTNPFFWGYNIYFFLLSLLMALGGYSSPLILFSLLIPLISMLLALIHRGSNQPTVLLRIFFLFETPLLVLNLLYTAFQDVATPFISLLAFSFLCLPIVLYLIESKMHLTPIWSKVSLFIHQLVLMSGMYLAFLFSFWIPVILLGTLTSILDFNTYNVTILTLSIELLGKLLLGSFVFIFTSLPFVLLYLVFKSFIRTRQSLADVVSPSHLASLQAMFAVLIVTVAFVSAYHPPANSQLVKLKTYNLTQAFAQKSQLAAELAPHKESLKKAILALNTSTDFYFFDSKDNTLSNLYSHILHFPAQISDSINSLFLLSAYPFVNTNYSNESYQLSNSYFSLFGEYVHPQPTPAVSSQNVLLSSRNVKVVPSALGDFATITIDEEYDNQTFQNQEVLYEFSLPTGTVMTDLNLGPDLEFPGVIAPKGAAQRTYESQLQINRDPALLEQTGPHQFRLRIFPIPGKNDLATLKGRRQRVQFTYITPAERSGYGLPEYSRKLNIFTNTSSIQTYPENQLFAPCTKDCNPSFGSLDQLSNEQIAIFYDVSAKSNNSRLLQDFQKELNDVPNFITKNSITIYPFNQQLGDGIKLTSSKIPSIPHFGATQNLSAISTAQTLKFTSAFIIAPETAPLTFFNTFPLPAIGNPVYLVHPTTPPAYPLAFTSRLIQSRGNSTTSLGSAMRELVLLRSGASPKSPVDDYAQLIEKVTNTQTEISGNITIMDELNTLAEKAKIVTPYSSFLALVNQTQKDILAQQQNQYNRYQDQPLLENIVNQPIELSPAFTRGFGGISGNIGSRRLSELTMPQDSGGSGMLANLSIDRIRENDSRFNTNTLLGTGMSLFVLVNIIALLGAGLAFYVFKLLRHKK